MIKRVKSQIARIKNGLLIGVCLMPYTAHATSIESILTKSTTFLQGSLARSAGVVAIICSGYVTLVMQKMPKEQFIMILLGLGIIFGGSSLYSTLIG